MSNLIEMEIRGKRYNTWINYEVSRNIYSGIGTFTFETDAKLEKIYRSDRCNLLIDGQRFLTGIIDSESKTYDKYGITYKYSGRDLLGLADDQYCTEFPTFEAVTLKRLADSLLGNVPILKECAVRLGSRVIGGLDVAGGDLQIEHGQTVFQVLRDAAILRSVVFYMNGKGEIVFDYPAAYENVEFTLIVEEKNGKLHNRSQIISALQDIDSTRHYRNIWVFGQTDEDDFNDTNMILLRKFIDDSAPINKTKVVVKNDNTNINVYGKMLIEQQRLEAEVIKYTINGHTQNGKIWEVNKPVFVRDDIFQIDRNKLIYGVTYKLSETEGTTTELQIGQLGTKR